MRSRWPSYLILFVSVGVTLVSTFTISTITKAREKARFGHSTEQLQHAIEHGLNKYLTLLDSVRALAVAKISMNPIQFHAFVEALDLRKNYRGIESLGLAIQVASTRKEELIKTVRDLGVSEFHIWPPSDLPEICPLVIVEPRNDRSLASIGYDIFVEAEQWKTAKAATENGNPTASATVSLDPASAASRKHGFLMLVPVYRGGGLPETIEERRTNVMGFVHCAFQTEELLQTIIGRNTNSAIGLRIYDGDGVSGDSLIYQSAGWPPSSKFNRFNSTNGLSVASRRWTLAFASEPNFGSGVNPTPITLLGGLVLSGLLWTVAASQSRAREAAERHAHELRQSEGALRESDARRLRAETFSSIMVAHVGLDGSLLKIPAALSVLVGYAEPELRGKSIKAISHPDDREPDERLRETLLTGRNKSANIETRLLARDGNFAWLAFNYSLVTDADGKPLYFLTYIQDISERKRNEAEIRKLNTGLEQRVAARTAELEVAIEELKAFSYSVSHDLRAPLRHIDGFVTMLKDNSSVVRDEKAQRFARIISESAQQMGQLIDALLDFSRLGRVDLAVMTEVDVNEIVREIRQLFVFETERRVIDWRIADLPKIPADRTLLRQVFANLVSNAVKYSAPRSPAIIEIGSEDRDQEVAFFVRDNGVGFDMNYADKLFCVFQRLHRKEEFEGTGIGLANVHRIVSRHGGRTWAESVIDHGATFYFTLPKRA
jgi:PAS domain S-box-containing protein